MKGIELFYEDIPPLALQKSQLEKYVKRLIIRELKNFGEISVVLCSDDYLLSMNQQYLKHDYYTDIITFDYVEENRIAGDLFISLDRIRANAKKYKVELKKELFRVIFHGILHLIGYDDKTKQEKEIMRQKENLYLGEVDFEEIEL